MSNILHELVFVDDTKTAMECADAGRPGVAPRTLDHVWLVRYDHNNGLMGFHEETHPDESQLYPIELCGGCLEVLVGKLMVRGSPGGLWLV